jgi:hypothetical protein
VTPLERFLDAARRLGLDPKKAGSGYRMLCPAHDDHHPSLSVREGTGGRVLVKCHANAGCSLQAILDPLDLKERDLFASGGVRGDARRRQVAVYDYTDESGVLLYQVVRFEPKDFRQRRPDGSGGWAWNLQGVKRVVFRLRDVLAAAREQRVAYVVEGEKDVLGLERLGLVATTNAGGAGKWLPSYAEAFRGARGVYVIPDNDTPGRKHAEEVARSVYEIGIPVKIVALPNLPEKADVSDWLASGGTGEQLRTLAHDAPLWKPFDSTAIEAEIVTKQVTPAAFQPFPIGVLPEALRRFVIEGSQMIGCDTAYVALPTLSAIASAIGNTHRIQLKRGWTEPAIIWATTIGESGTAKSPAQELALRPIHRRQHEAIARQKESLAAYDREMLAYNQALAAWKRKCKSVDPPEKPAEPFADRCWTDDTTTEALAVMLQRNPRGLLLARDELSGWFDFDRYSGKGSDAARWLEMFGGRPLIVDRKGGGSLYVPRASVSIAGGIQPRVLNRVLGAQHRENGLLARMLLAHPPRRAKRWSDADISQGVEDELSLVFDGLFSLTHETAADGAERPRLVRLSPQALEIWKAWYDELAREHCDMTGDLAAAWSKLEGYAARLALVLHLARWVAAAGSGTGSYPGVMLPDSIEAGITLSRWFGAEAERVYGILAEPRESRDRRMLVEWIERRGGEVTARDLAHGLRAFRGLTDTAEAALSELVKFGIGCWIAREPSALGGRPTRAFRLNTTVTVTETPKKTADPRVSVTESPATGSDDEDEDVIPPPSEARP